MEVNQYLCSSYYNPGAKAGATSYFYFHNWVWRSRFEMSEDDEFDFEYNALYDPTRYLSGNIQQAISSGDLHKSGIKVLWLSCLWVLQLFGQ